MSADAGGRGSPQDWLRFARSDLSFAKAPLPNQGLLETICFHAQQAVEKSLKAILVARRIDFPKTHNIKTLVEHLPVELRVQFDSEAASELTDYAVVTRYPAEFEPVDAEETRQAVDVAEEVVIWAEALLRAEGKG